MNILKINDNPLSFLGDIHGNWNVITDHFESFKITNSNLIQVGDFGVGYQKKDKEAELLSELSKFLIERNSFLYVIRGNHDDPAYFDNGTTYENIIFLKDYTILQNANHNVLCIGGAVSIDRKLSRAKSDIIGRSLWWEGEKFNYDEVIIENQLNDLSIDIVVTHTAPKVFYPQNFNRLVMDYAANDSMLIHDLVLERSMVQNLYESLYDKDMPKYWFYGHFHMSNREIVEEKVNAILLNISEFYYL